MVNTTTEAALKSRLAVQLIAQYIIFLNKFPYDGGPRGTRNWLVYSVPPHGHTDHPNVDFEVVHCSVQSLGSEVVQFGGSGMLIGERFC